jgi:hypothetical protein
MAVSEIANGLRLTGRRYTLHHKRLSDNVPCAAAYVNLHVKV